MESEEDDASALYYPRRRSWFQRVWRALLRFLERLSWLFFGQPSEEATGISNSTRATMLEARLLVLGASDTGKSTFMKQMRYVFGDSFPIADRRRHQPHIRRNMLESLHKIVRAMEALHVPYTTTAARDAAMRFADPAPLEAFLQDDSPMDPSLVEQAQALWEDSGVQEVFRRGNEYHLITNADYFITSAERILQNDYIPTIDDILHMRYPTQCSVTHSYDIGDIRMTMHDVGGQRSERERWVQHFSDPTAILFLASLSEYDQEVEEALDYEAKNRVQESLDIFEDLLGYLPFHNTPIILLLNKSDIFRKKILYHSLADYFPEYDGPEGDEMKGREFLSRLYEDLALKHDRHFVSRFTEATNTENFKAIFAFVKTNVSRNMMSRGGLL